MSVCGRFWLSGRLWAWRDMKWHCVTRHMAWYIWRDMARQGVARRDVPATSTCVSCDSLPLSTRPWAEPPPSHACALSLAHSLRAPPCLHPKSGPSNAKVTSQKQPASANGRHPRLARPVVFSWSLVSPGRWCFFRMPLALWTPCSPSLPPPETSATKCWWVADSCVLSENAIRIYLQQWRARFPPLFSDTVKKKKGNRKRESAGGISPEFASAMK